MRIITAPNQIVIQFGGEIGETAGAFRGASLRQLQFIVEDDSDVITGRIDRGSADFPRDFPREELAKLLGERFEQFEAQYTALENETLALRQEKVELSDRLSAAEAEKAAM